MADHSLPIRLLQATKRVVRNPHFWVVVVMSVALLFIYQAWPWREFQFERGVWRYFSWLSALDPLVVNVELRYHLIGVLFFIPIIYGSVMLSWPGGIFAWLLALIWVLPNLARWSGSTFAINMALLLLPAMVVAVVTLERQSREREKRYFAERERERQAYIAKLVEAQEGERRRIALEIHDEALQTLMVIANKSEALAAETADEKQKSGNLWVKQEVLQTMDDLRALSLNLRPSVLDCFGLVSGLRWLVNNANTQNGVQIEISVEGEERELSDLAEVTVFRVVQEAIHNIQRHARARTGSVALRFGDDRLDFVVHDDGVGFAPPNRLAPLVNQSKLGIMGMEQRILSVGGTMKIESRPGGGTTLSVSVPYQ